MSVPVGYDQRSSQRRATRTIAIAYGLLVAIGLYHGDSTEQIFAYLLVISAAVLPSVLWVRWGADGVPVFPAIALAYIPYFAWPALRNNENTQAYLLSEIAQAGVTVTLFLAVAAIAWGAISSLTRRVGWVAQDHGETSRTVNLVLAGLVVGFFFHLSSILGLLNELGSFYGLVRSIAVTFVIVSCFLLGVSRAQGILRGKALLGASVGLAMITIMAWSSLFLVGGLTYLLAAAMGYVLVEKRIPFLILGLIFAAVTILHAGKAGMRDKYWIQHANYSESISAAQVPLLMIEWVGEGVHAIASGEVEATIVDRASLIQMILLVQAATPGRVDYLGGETYALLPSILVPRFIESDKPASQIGMDLLNVRYDVLSVEGTATTAVGWGLIAEAYANFGYFGVLGMGLLFGAFCGGLSIWSGNAGITSIPTLTSIAAMMVLANVEADFIQIVTSLLQSFGAVLVFSVLYRWYADFHSPASGSRAKSSVGSTIERGLHEKNR